MGLRDWRSWACGFEWENDLGQVALKMTAHLINADV